MIHIRGRRLVNVSDLDRVATCAIISRRLPPKGSWRAYPQHRGLFSFRDCGEHGSNALRRDDHVDPVKTEKHRKKVCALAFFVEQCTMAMTGSRSSPRSDRYSVKAGPRRSERAAILSSASASSAPWPISFHSMGRNKDVARKRLCRDACDPVTTLPTSSTSACSYILRMTAIQQYQ